MTDEFGKSGNDQTGQDEGKNFGVNTDGSTTGTDTGSQGIDSTEYEALRKRDENAQQHIARLESENAELRDKYTEVENKLTNATTLDDALARIANQGNDQSKDIDPTDVAQVVREVLGQEQTATKRESNWQNVTSKLTEVYGDWATADTKVQEKARELDITLEEAGNMARNNPKAFMQLFVPAQSTTNHKAGSSTGTGDIGQKGVSNAPGQVRDKAYYNELRRKNPNKYWSVDVQAQLRRDLFSE